MIVRVLRILVCLAVLAPAANGLAQAKNYQVFRAESGLVGAIAPGTAPAYGFGAMFEPKFNVHDQLAVGMRLEGAVLFSGKIAGQDVAVGMRTMAAVLVKGEWFFTQTSVRPFVGFGLGGYTFAGTSAGTGGAGIEAGRNFGIAPQLGVNFGGFRLAATYHLVFGKALVTVNAGESVSVPRNYLAIEMSFRLGGRRLVGD